MIKPLYNYLIGVPLLVIVGFVGFSSSAQAHTLSEADSVSVKAMRVLQVALDTDEVEVLHTHLTMSDTHTLPTVDTLLQPVSINDERLKILRNAIELLGEGDRQAARGRLDHARNLWLESATAYTDGQDPLGRADAYLRLGNSYLPSPLTCLMNALLDPQNHTYEECDFRLRFSDLILLATLDEAKLHEVAGYYLEALFAAAEVYEALIQKELTYETQVLEQADQRYDEGLAFYRQGNCFAAIPLWTEAGRLYQSQHFGSGEVRVLVVQALCQLEQQRYQQALSMLLEALTIAKDLPLGTPATERYLAAGRLYEQGDYLGALAGYEEVLAIYQNNHDQEGLAQTSHELGNVHAQLGEYTTAKTWYERALPLFIAVNNEYTQGNIAAVYHNLGNIATIAGEYDEAYINFAKATKIRQSIGDPVHEVISMGGLGLALRGQGNLSEALAILDHAWTQQQRLPPDVETEGDLLHNTGLVYYSQGDYRKALTKLEAALALRQALSEPLRTTKSAATLSDIASVQVGLGLFEEAAANYRHVLTPAGQVNEILATRIKINMTAIALFQGDYQRAIVDYLDILSLVGEQGDPFAEADVRFKLSFAYSAIGDPGRAEFHLNQAMKLAETNGYWERAITAQMDLAVLHAQVGNLTEADNATQKVLELLHNQGNTTLLSRLLYVLTLREISSNHWETAQEYLQEALTLSNETGSATDQTRLVALQNILDYVLHDGQLVDLVDQHIEEVERTGDFLDDILFRYVLAAAYIAKREYTAAGAQLAQVIDRLETQQATLTSAALRQTMMGQAANIYNLATIVAFLNGNHDDAFRFAEQARARAFLNQLRNQPINPRVNAMPMLLQQEQETYQRLDYLEKLLAEEQNKPLEQQRPAFINTMVQELEALRHDYRELLTRIEAANPDYAALVNAEVVTLDTLQQQLIDDQTTLLIYFHLDNPLLQQTIAWVVDRETVQVKGLATTPLTITRQIDTLQKGLKTKGFNQQLSSALYTTLFAPLRPLIHNQNLIVAPHGVLHFLPFGALWNEQAQQHLIEDYAITYIPSASALPLIQAKRNPNQGRVLVMGDPSGDLQYAAQEVEAIAAIYGVNPQVHDQATEEYLVAQAPQVDMLHLAAHGVYNPFNPLFTQIELVPTADQDGNLEVHEVYGLNLANMNLVVLSACESGEGALSRGDDIVGLPQAFIIAGAPAVVTTLWRIDDEASSAVMVAFYRSLHTGLPPAAALRKAQLAVLAEEQWQSPYYWAAFVLNGDDQGGETKNE